MSPGQIPSRRPGATLYYHLIREMGFPTVFTLGGLTLLVLTRELLGFSDLVINRGLGAGVVAWIAFYQTVPLLSQTLPFAVLVGALVALGRLGADREILALEASGLSARRLGGPVVLFACTMTLVGLGLSAAAAPWANRSFDGALESISRDYPGATVRAGVVHRFGDWRLQAPEVTSSGDRMRGVLLWMPNVGETVFAESGALDPDPSGPTRITLRKGTVILSSRARLRQVRFDTLSTLLPESDQRIERIESERIDAATLSELIVIGWSGDGDEEAARRARMELHRRFALPVATLLFGILVLPLFLMRGAFSRSSGGLLGVLATLVYYGLVQLGNGLSRGGWIDAGLAVWLPNLGFALADAVFVFRLQRMSAFDGHLERQQPLARLRAGLHQLRDRLAELRRGANGGPEVQPPSVGRARRSRIRTHGWALQRYVSMRFLEMLGFSFAVLLMGYLLVDILERLQWFARFDATASEAVRFYGLRIPLLISRIVPMSLLVATALTVSLVAVQGELTGMRSCGIPAPRGMLPLLIICAIIAPLSFVLNNEVVPRTNTLTEYLKATEIKAEELWQAAPDDGETRPRAVWFRDGHRLLEAERLDPQLGTAIRLTMYELGADGLPVNRQDAVAARHIGGGIWRLFEPVRVEITPDELRRIEAPRFAALWEGAPAEMDTRNLSVGDLREEIQSVTKSGYDATVFRVDLYAKLAAPFACLVLPAVAFFFAVSGPPYPSTAASLVVSLVVAVSSVLLIGVFSSLGYGKILSPVIAGVAPMVLFGFVALYLGLRLRGLFSKA